MTSAAMMRDVPPGHRRFRFGSWHYGRGCVIPWLGEPGDIVVQYGSRLGYRYWVVVDVEQLRKWASVLLRPLVDDELGDVVAEAEEGGLVGGWFMTSRHIDRHRDLLPYLPNRVRVS